MGGPIGLNMLHFLYMNIKKCCFFFKKWRGQDPFAPSPAATWLAKKYPHNPKQ